MKFDYTLREGVVTRGTGIELMRSIGLNVSEPRSRRRVTLASETA